MRGRGGGPGGPSPGSKGVRLGAGSPPRPAGEVGGSSLPLSSGLKTVDPQDSEEEFGAPVALQDPEGTHQDAALWGGGHDP